jgi:L-lactate dehydrogenase complex protein LldG
MTNPVIENVRRSLGRTAQSPLGPRPVIYKSRPPGASDAEGTRFLEEVDAALQTLVQEQAIHRATAWETPYLKQLGVAEILNSLSVELVPPNADKHEMAVCDLGVTEADYLLPETGTLVLRSSALQPRAVSLLPRVHLAIVRPAMLRPDLHQVFAEARDQPYLLFITGPSRTADIELTVTLGVHGPKNLYVWMLDE